MQKTFFFSKKFFCFLQNRTEGTGYFPRPTPIVFAGGRHLSLFLKKWAQCSHPSISGKRAVRSDSLRHTTKAPARICGNLPTRCLCANNSYQQGRPCLRSETKKSQAVRAAPAASSARRFRMRRQRGKMRAPPICCCYTRGWAGKKNGAGDLP